jgi:hypothetical protein
MRQLLLLLLRTTNSSARGCWRCDKKSKQNEIKQTNECPA